MTYVVVGYWKSKVGSMDNIVCFIHGRDIVLVKIVGELIRFNDLFISATLILDYLFN